VAKKQILKKNRRHGKKYFAMSLSFPIFAFYILRIKNGEEQHRQFDSDW
jgi:hypothetical protein